MQTVRVVWVDDAIDVVLATWAAALETQLRKNGILLHLTPWAYGAGARDLAQDADILIVDIDLGTDPALPNAFLLLERMRTDGIARPVILFSAEAKRFERELEQFRHHYLGICDKSPEGLAELGQLICSFMGQPPVTAAVVSDLHVGRLGADVDARRRFFEVVDREMAEVRRLYRVNHLLALGDFAWRGQADDVSSAHELMQRMRRALGLTAPNAFHFCAGNHDFDRSVPHGWRTVYGELVRRFAMDDPGVSERYKDRIGRIGEFWVPEDLLAVGPGATQGVRFASLCSVAAGSGATIGAKQLAALDALVRADNGTELRIALMHHPLYPSPQIGEGAEDAIPTDSAMIYRALAQKGFQLLLTGHSHYSCVHSHELAVMNGPTSSRSSQRLIVVSLATLGGDPSPATPFQQYCLLRVGHQAPNGMRDVKVTSRLFDPERREFVAGDTVSFQLSRQGIFSNTR